METAILDYNRVVVIGTIEKTPTRARRRTSLGAFAQEVSVRLMTPYGEPWTMRVVVPTVDTVLEPGQIIVLEGSARLAREPDRRFAREEQVRGRFSQTMKLIVEQVRMPGESEVAAVGFSHASLQGTVTEPPQFVPHPHVPGLRVVLTTLRVVRLRPSPLLGSRMVREEPMLVHLSVPRDLEHVAMLYKPGNRVQIEGEIDCVMVAVDARDPDFVAMREQLERDWHATSAQTAPDPETHRARRQQFVAAVRALSDMPRWRILVEQITPLHDSVPLSRREARVLRAGFVSRRRDGGRRAVPQRTNGVAQSEAVRDPHGVLADATPSRRPRRRRRVSPESAPPVDDGAIILSTETGSPTIPSASNEEAERG